MSNKLGFILQIGLKFAAIGLGIFIVRFQNTSLPKTELAELTKINAYTISILGFVTLGIPQIIQKFYTHNYHDFQNKKQEFAEFWTSFLIFRILSYFFAILIILTSFGLSGSNNLFAIIGLFSAQFIILADISFRSVADSVGKSWQFSFSDFFGKGVLVLGLLIVTGGQFLANTIQISNFSWFIILSILAYFAAFCVDFIWQKKLTPLTFISFKVFSQVWETNRSEIIFLGISSFLTSLFLRTDILILDYFKPNSDSLVGYSNSYRLFEIASVVPSLIVPVLASRFWQKCQRESNLQKKSEQKFKPSKSNSKPNNVNSQLQTKVQTKVLDKEVFDCKDNYKDREKLSNIKKTVPILNSKNNRINQKIFTSNLKTFGVKIFFLGVLCALFLGFLAPLGLWIIDPLNYYSQFSLQVIWPLCGILIFNSLSIFIGNLNIFLGGFRSELALSFGNFLVAALCYLTLIPKFGILGAAFASLFIYGIDTILRVFFLWQTWIKYNQN